MQALEEGFSTVWYDDANRQPLKWLSFTLWFAGSNKTKEKI
jgi:hypothetical protein